MIAGIGIFQYAAALGVVLLSIILKKLFSKTILHFLQIATKKTKTKLDDNILLSIETPIQAAIILAGIYIAVDILGISAAFLDSLLKSFVIFIIFWSFYNAVGVFEHSIYAFVKKSSKELAQEISDLLLKIAKFFIAAVGVIAILEEWQIDVSTFVASLGIGGLAFALAAKDTVANFFGSVMIFLDKSFKIGDWIKGAGVEGIVEKINIRTTKIRTFEKSLITVPNAALANAPVENFSRRGIRRINMRLGLTYSTTTAQMEAIVTELRELLHAREDIDKETIFIYFDEFAASSLSIFCYFFTATADWQKYLQIREAINLEIIRLVEKHGAEFAFPSQSIYFENELPLPPKDTTA